MADAPNRDTETPRTTAERVRVSERLGGVEDRLGDVERVMQDLHVAMWRLVEIEERRDRREAAVLERESQERSERGKWLRSLLSRDIIVPLLAALGAGGVTYGVRGPVYQHPTSPTDAPPAVTAPAPPGPHQGPQEIP